MLKEKITKIGCWLFQKIKRIIKRLRSYKWPFKIYDSLSSANRIQFWVVTVNFMATLLAFWLGISYQYTVVSDSADQNKILTHINLIKEYQAIGNNAIVDNSILPSLVKYQTLVRLGNNIITDSQAEAMLKSLAPTIPQQEAFNKFIEEAERKVKALSKLKYCFTEEEAQILDEKCRNASLALIELYLLDTDTVYNKEEYDEYIKILFKRFPTYTKKYET